MEIQADWFAGRLKELREQAGLTQPELAEKAGMNRFGIAKLEQAVTKPSWETVVALCKALQVGCDAFLKAPATQDKAGRGRPPQPKTEASEAQQKRPRGRPRKQAPEPKAKRKGKGA